MVRARSGDCRHPVRRRSRLWPLSRTNQPKQFIPLVDGLTLLQATARRIAAVEPSAAPIVVCNVSHRFMVAEQLRAIGVAPAAVVLEPAGHNTAPAIAAAALEARAPESSARAQSVGEPVLLVLPADHLIRDEARFAAAVREAPIEAASGRLVTFGVPPARAETGYGYIQAGRPTGLGAGVRRVDRFIEKLDARSAAAYVKDGRYWWNSGMFVFGAGRYLHELGVHANDVREAVVEAHRKAVSDLGFLRLDARAFAASPAISVDHAVMERTSEAVMVPLEAGWSDIGSWATLSELDTCDEAGNVVQGDARIRGSGGDPAPSHGASTVGCLRGSGWRRWLQGQAHRRQPRPGVVAAVAPASRGALDRGAGGRTGDARRRHLRGGGESVDVHSPGCPTPAGESADRAARARRGANRQLYLGEDDIVRYDDVYGRAGPCDDDHHQ